MSPSPPLELPQPPLGANTGVSDWPRRKSLSPLWLYPRQAYPKMDLERSVITLEGEPRLSFDASEQLLV